MKLVGVILFSLSLNSCSVKGESGDDQYLLVSTENGPVRGAWNLNIKGKIGKFFVGADPAKNSRYFASIPFAEPPFGENRFRSPKPYTKVWGSIDANGVVSGQVLKATAFPPACPQDLLLAFSQTENCLFLNVFTPPPNRTPKPGDGKKLLPVMIYIYGGAFHLGDSYSNGVYNARHLTDTRDVIVVTINHRVGALGFFYSKEEGSGNVGLEDQREAFRWVKRNIANFGGDPDNVTLFGVSSGATSIVLHTVSPATEPGLFHKVIVQSAPLGTVIVRKDEIAKTSLELAITLNCTINGVKPDMKCLREIPFERIVKASLPSLNDPRKDPTVEFEKFSGGANQIVDYMGDSYKWWPSIDGKNNIGDPNLLIAQGKQMDIPMIIGVQKEEGGLWFLGFDTPFTGAAKKQKMYNAASYQERLKLIFGRDYDTMLQTYPVQTTAEGNVLQFINLMTDFAWLCPSEQFALDWTKKNKKTYFYSWNQPTFPPMPRCLKYSCHANEVPYLFNTLWPLVGEARKSLARQVQAYWTNFAATGNPNLLADGTRDTNSPYWPTYDSKQVHQELGDRVGPENRRRIEFCQVLSTMNITSYYESSKSVRMNMKWMKKKKFLANFQ